MILKKGIATILSTATLLTAVSPCAFAEGNSKEETTKSMSTTGKVILAGAGAIGLVALGGIIYHAVNNSHVKVETLKGKPIYDKYMELKDAVTKCEYNKVEKFLNENKELDINAWFKYDIEGCGRAEENNTLLHIAIKQRSFDICKLLIDRGSDVNAEAEYNRTPLHLAAHRGLYDICELLIDRGADINAKCPSNSSTPLRSAVENGNVATCKVLLKKGAHMYPGCFFAAVYRDNTEICELFINNGFDIHANNTCLHEAAEDGSLNALNLLIDKGINVNIKDSGGSTALHIAAINRLESCKVLIEKGADINAKDNRDKTPLDYIDELPTRYFLLHKEEIRKFLIDNGAKHGNELK